MGSIIVDIEPLIVIIFGLDYPLHGFFHSFLGGTIVAGLLSVVLYYLQDKICAISRFFKLDQKRSFIIILLSCLLGVYSHIILDSFLYTDIKPFFPLDINPFYGFLDYNFVYTSCAVSFLLGGLFYLVKLTRGRLHLFFKVISIIAFILFLVLLWILFNLQIPEYF